MTWWTLYDVAALIVIGVILWLLTAGVWCNHEARQDEAERERWLTDERCRELRDGET